MFISVFPEGYQSIEDVSVCRLCTVSSKVWVWFSVSSTRERKRYGGGTSVRFWDHFSIYYLFHAFPRPRTYSPSKYDTPLILPKYHFHCKLDLELSSTSSLTNVLSTHLRPLRSLSRDVLFSVSLYHCPSHRTLGVCKTHHTDTYTVPCLSLLRPY